MKKSAAKTLLHFFGKKPKVVESIEPDISPGTSESISVASFSVNVVESASSSNLWDTNIQASKPAEILQNSHVTDSNLSRRDPISGKEAALEYFKDGPYQPVLAQFPETNGRRFRSAWYSEFEWLEYSVSGDKAFCFPCRLFGRIGSYEETFISKGFKNWKKATQRFKEHGCTSSHLSALQRWQEGLKSKESIAENISSHHKEKVKNNRDYLKILFETLLYLGRQGLAVRGHREEESSHNRGNYIELLKLRSADNTLLKKMFLERDNFFNYVHHDVQNEMLEILSSQIKKDIIENVKRSKYFSIIVDETPDISNHEQVAIILRFVADNLKIEEKFIGFYKTDSTDGETLYGLLLSVLNNVGLEASNIVAQCYDGARNMSGIHKGVAARIQEIYPHAIYVHCYMHSLNLALVDSSKNVSMVRNVFSVVQQLYCFIEASPKRHAIFNKIKEKAVGQESKEGKNNLSLKALSDTRFSCRYESLRAVQHHLPEILQTLEEIEAYDPRAGGEAHGLLLCIKNFDFVFGLNMMKQVFEKTNILSKYIQNISISVHEVVEVAKQIVAAITDLRNETKFEIIWSEAKLFCEKHAFEGPVIPRKRKVPQKIGGGNIYPDIDSSRDFCKKTAYYPFLDNIVENIKSRFDKNQMILLCHMESVLAASFNPKSIATDEFKEALVVLEETYGIESDCLSAELDIFSRKAEFISYDGSLILRLLGEFKSEKSQNQIVFPRILQLLKLFLTVPFSTASAERSFSVLKRIKNYLRNTMKEERLTHLALLAIEKETEINLDECVEIYSRRKQRHISLF